MSVISVAAVISTASHPPGIPLPATVVQLMDPHGIPAAVGVTNQDGYVLFPNVADSFSGWIILSGAAAYYQQPLSWTGKGPFTLRVGSSALQPDDVQLPAAVPFV